MKALPRRGTSPPLPRPRAMHQLWDKTCKVRTSDQPPVCRPSGIITCPGGRAGLHVAVDSPAVAQAAAALGTRHVPSQHVLAGVGGVGVVVALPTGAVAGPRGARRRLLARAEA